MLDITAVLVQRFVNGTTIQPMNLLRKIAIRAKSLKRRFIYDPLLTLPECQARITAEEQRLYGSEALNYQAIAQNLVFAVQYVVGAAVEGDIAEFGTATGRTANVISASMASLGAEKTLHLFDS